MNKLAVCLAVLCLAAAPALADEPDLESLLENAKPAGDRWEHCAAQSVKAQLRSSRSAEDIASRALDSCEREQAGLRRVLTRELGADRAQAVTLLVRSIYRTNLVRVITTLRSR
jgi:hypothetical protein